MSKNNRKIKLIYEIMRSKPGFPFATKEYWCSQLCLAGVCFVSYLALVLLSNTIITSSILMMLSYSVLVLLTISVGHQALHGSLLASKATGRALGLLLFGLVGVDGNLWQNRHVRDHHKHPNTKGRDADLDNNSILRLAPYTSHSYRHRFQHLYAPLVYSVATIITILIDDLRQCVKEFRKASPSVRPWILTHFLFNKCIFFSFWFLLPLCLNENLDITKLAIGLSIASIPSGWLFLPIAAAHLNILTEFYDGENQKPFAISQQETTVDFAGSSKVMTMLYGGLNCHLAHHLFPKIACCHYSEIYRLMRIHCPELLSKAADLTIIELLCSHFKFLHRLGRKSHNAAYDAPPLSLV